MPAQVSLPKTHFSLRMGARLFRVTLQSVCRLPAGSNRGSRTFVSWDEYWYDTLVLRNYDRFIISCTTNIRLSNNKSLLIFDTRAMLSLSFPSPMHLYDSCLNSSKASRSLKERYARLASWVQFYWQSTRNRDNCSMYNGRLKLDIYTSWNIYGWILVTFGAPEPSPSIYLKHKLRRLTQLALFISG